MAIFCSSTRQLQARGRGSTDQDLYHLLFQPKKTASEYKDLPYVVHLFISDNKNTEFLSNYTRGCDRIYPINVMQRKTRDKEQAYKKKKNIVNQCLTRRLQPLDHSVFRLRHRPDINYNVFFFKRSAPYLGLHVVVTCFLKRASKRKKKTKNKRVR